jgi:cation diffusion facilitator family transporter
MGKPVETCRPETPAAEGHPHGGHAPHHHHGTIDSDASGNRLLMTLALNLMIPAVQVVGGVMANSMALISDAVHNFSDFTAVFISYMAWRIGRKGASTQNTFGYRRAEIMASLLNAALLVGAAGIIALGAFHRLRNPAPVAGWLVFWVAAIGVVGNGLSAVLLHRDAQHSLNIRGAFLHMMGDLLVSVVVLINGLVLAFKPWYWLDPLLSLLIVVFILKNCWAILAEATGILMNATPRGLDIRAVRNTMETIAGVDSVHHLHAWRLSSTGIAFLGHVVVKEQPVSRTEAMARTIRRSLLENHGIDHATLQFETTACGSGDLFCENGCAKPNAPDPDPTLHERPG